MKKVLFATTALVATAGVAAADVTFGGLGRFGIDYNDSRGAGSETRIESRFRLIVTGTAESDNGLSFGAQIRYQANENTGTAGGTGGFNSPRFWVSSGPLTVSVGHVLGAIENMPGMYGGTIGLTGLGFANVVYNFGADAYTSGAIGRQGLDVIYSAGNWGVHLSHSATGTSQGGTATTERTALAVSYSMGNWNFALGGNSVNSSYVITPGATSDVAYENNWAATVGYSWDNLDLTFQYADNDYVSVANGAGSAEKYGIGVNYQVGTSTFIRGYVNHDASPNAYSMDGENYGIGFQHRLGGGTFIEGGVANTRNGGLTATEDAVRADLGLRFSF